MGDDRAGADHGAYSDRNVGKNCGVAADRGALAHARSQNCPVCLGLKLTLVGRGAWKTVVYKSDTVTDKHLILDLDALTNKRVRRNFAGLAHTRVLLNFHESANPGARSDTAPIQINEVFVEDEDITLEYHVLGNRHVTSGHQSQKD
jgi:hypothetical protein